MNRILPLLLLPLLLLAAACSTTSALPDDEQLYTGIKDITYADDPVKLRKQKGRDSTGVITAVANALEAVNNALEGKASLTPDSLQQGRLTLSKEQKKALKVAQARDEADFAVAREEVEAVLAYPPNNAIFGSSSMSWPWPFKMALPSPSWPLPWPRRTAYSSASR